MHPAPGQLWRSSATSTVYRVAEIDLSRPTPECVRLEVVEHTGGEFMVGLARWVELGWFERIGSFVREAA